MKLSVRLPLVLLVLVGVLAGAGWWILSASLQRETGLVQALRQKLTDKEKREAELSERLSYLNAGQQATDAAARAVKAVGTFTGTWIAQLNDRATRRSMASPAKWKDLAAALRAKASDLLDNVVITDARGKVAAAAPAESAAAGAVWLDAATLSAAVRGRRPRVETRISPDGKGRSLVVLAPYFGGPKRLTMGVACVQASLGNVLKEAAAAPSGFDVQLIVVENGVVLLSPTPDLVGQKLASSNEGTLAVLSSGAAAEVTFGLRRWQGFRQAVPGTALEVIALATGAAAGAPAAGGADSQSPAAPIVPFAVLAAVVAVIAVVSVTGPVSRIRALSTAVGSIAQGATSVELKGAAAKDEIGDLTRAIESLSVALSKERARRSEVEQTAATLQQDLAKSQTQVRELTDYQRDLETRARREKETLESELAGSRQELEGSRSESGELRRRGQAKEQSLAASVTQLQEQVASLQQSLAGAQAELASAQDALAKRGAGPSPTTDFSLFSEASEALSGEVSALLESVQGYVGQMIESGGEGGINDEQQEFLTTVINRSARSQRILGDLRDYSSVRMPSGLAREPIDLAALVMDVASTVQHVAEDKGMELALETAPDLPAVIGDEARLRQVLTVILQNAVRFTPEGGRVAVVALRMADTMAEVRIEDSADLMTVSADEMFGQFHSADEEYLQTRGSGLRYPLLRSIMEGHGGTIELSPGGGGGNMFTLRLPASEGPVPVTPAPVPMPVAEPMAESVFEPIAAAPAESFDWGALPAATASAAPAAPVPEAPVFSLESSPDLAAAPDFSAMPGADLSAGVGGETLDSIMAAPPSAEPAPGGGDFSADSAALGLWDFGTTPGAAAPPAGGEAPPAAEGSEQAPPLSFGSDEIIQE